MSTSPDIVIAIVQKSPVIQVRVTLAQWKGKTKVHVREYTPGPLPDQWWPSKGTCVDVERLPELVEAIQKALAEARRMGLLRDEERSA
jgi:hypothetical protein